LHRSLVKGPRPAPATVATMTTLVERLGRAPGARLLIVNCDGLGYCHAANQGVYEALRDGAATSASLMVPAPWARGAASAYRGEDVGVLLTLNAEHDLYRWGPLTHAPSLLDGDGGFPRTVHDVWEHADPDEVRRECRAQVERAIYWGFDVSHLDSHLFAMQLRPEFFDIYLDLAADFSLPVRLPGAETERAAGFPFRALATERGVVFPDHLVNLSAAGPDRSPAEVVSALEPGVTELYLRPAVDTPELRAMDAHWPARVHEHRALVVADGLGAAAAAAGVELIGFRALRRVSIAGAVAS
jgi:predicted glycoside hydrolase/deacetylase ChbG (UPF0249 family)